MKTQIGVDGNAAFALLGDNLQEGVAEFVEIKDGDVSTAQIQACCLLAEKIKMEHEKVVEVLREFVEDMDQHCDVFTPGYLKARAIIAKP